MAEIVVLVLYRETWLDEEILLQKSLLIFTGQATPFQDIVLEYPPLFIPVYGFFQMIFGPSVYVGRIVSAVLLCASLAMLYAVERRFTNRW